MALVFLRQAHRTFLNRVPNLNIARYFDHSERRGLHRSFWSRSSDLPPDEPAASDNNISNRGKMLDLNDLPVNVAKAGIAVYGWEMQGVLQEQTLKDWFYCGDPKYFDIDDETIRVLADQNLSAASKLLEQQLLREPHNLFALRLAQDLHLHNGDFGNLGGTVSRVLPFWDTSNPGYATLLSLHSRGLGETHRWDLAEEAGMRALSENNQHGNSDHKCLALNSVCDMLFLSGRSREGLRLIRELSAELGPSKGDLRLDIALACQKASFYIDLGSPELADHQFDLLEDVVPNMKLDELSRFSSLLWRSQCASVLRSQTRFQTEGQNTVDLQLARQAALDHSKHKKLIWQSAWKRWKELAGIKVSNAFCNLDNDELGSFGKKADGLIFGPSHAALATLVYGAQLEFLIGDQEVSNQRNASPSAEQEIDSDLKSIWLRADVGSSVSSPVQNILKALLAQSNTSSSQNSSVFSWNHKQAASLLMPFQYNIHSTLGCNAIVGDSIQTLLPMSCLLGNQASQGRAILAERTFLRPGSPLLWSEYSGSLFAAGETLAAQAADSKAASLGFGQGGWSAH